MTYTPTRRADFLAAAAADRWDQTWPAWMPRLAFAPADGALNGDTAVKIRWRQDFALIVNHDFSATESPERDPQNQPWAGPLVVGAVVLGGAKIDGLTDSKKLTKIVIIV